MYTLEQFPGGEKKKIKETLITDVKSDLRLFLFAIGEGVILGKWDFRFKCGRVASKINIDGENTTSSTSISLNSPEKFLDIYLETRITSMLPFFRQLN